MKITLLGDVPSKKNSKRIVPVNGRHIIISSKNYLDWERDQLKLIKYTVHEALIENDYQLSVRFYPSTKRKFDLSNKVESIQDLLVKAGVISDDNYCVINSLHVYFGEVDRNNPRAEIEIL